MGSPPPSDLGTLTERWLFSPRRPGGQDRVPTLRPTVLRMELALAEGDPALFEKHRGGDGNRFAAGGKGGDSRGEEAAALPRRRPGGELLEGIGLEQVEESGCTPELAPFLDRKKKTVVYSNSPTRSGVSGRSATVLCRR